MRVATDLSEQEALILKRVRLFAVSNQILTASAALKFVVREWGRNNPESAKGDAPVDDDGDL